MTTVTWPPNPIPDVSGITQPPAGYSTFLDQYSQPSMWVLHVGGSGFRSMSAVRFLDVNETWFSFKLDDEGNVVLNADMLAAQVRAYDNLFELHIVKDSEMPAEGMSEFHTHFNETTKKFELPYIEDLIHAQHERGHDSDVAAAVASLCEVEIDIMHRKAVLVNLNPDQKAHAKAEYADFDECVDGIVSANAEAAIERAWLKAHGGIRHSGVFGVEQTFVDAAHSFATQYLEVINSKTTSQLAGRKYQYHLCMFRGLMNDRGKTTDRFLPRGVTIVKRKSSPAVATEITGAELFAKLKALISPVEGTPK